MPVTQSVVLGNSSIPGMLQVQVYSRPPDSESSWSQDPQVDHTLEFANRWLRQMTPISDCTFESSVYFIEE